MIYFYCYMLIALISVVFLTIRGYIRNKKLAEKYGIDHVDDLHFGVNILFPSLFWFIPFVAFVSLKITSLLLSDN